MIGYANYVRIVDEVAILIHEVVKARIMDETAKHIFMAILGSISAGGMSVYTEFKSAFDKVVKDGVVPDFEGEIPFPPPPPSIPDERSAVSWFQLGWNAIESALYIAAQKSSKLRAALDPLEKAGNELVKELNKYFGKLKFPSPPKSSNMTLLTLSTYA